jgi:hypothetical protein
MPPFESRDGSVAIRMPADSMVARAEAPMTNCKSWYHATMPALVEKVFIMRDILFARHVESMSVRGKSLRGQGIR